MRKLSYIGAAVLLAACAIAGPMLQRSVKSAIVMGATTGGTNTITADLWGYIEELTVTCSDGVSTGAVVVAVQPSDAKATAYNIATNSVVASRLYRPRVDATDISGTALSSDPPVRYCLMGDSISYAVTGSPTNVTWTLTIKLSDN